MGILGPDGQPARKMGVEPDPNKPMGLGGNRAGWIIVRVDAKGRIAAVGDRDGNMAITDDFEAAKALAAKMANEELLPNKDQKVVTPLQQSAIYMVMRMLVDAQIQAKLKDPQQILAPQGKLNG